MAVVVTVPVDKAKEAAEAMGSRPQAWVVVACVARVEAERVGCTAVGVRALAVLVEAAVAAQVREPEPQRPRSVHTQRRVAS